MIFIYFSSSDTEISEAYSGDQTNINNVKKHNVTKVIKPTVTFGGNAFRFCIVKLCPRVAVYTPVSLIDSEQFNYATNTTGKVVYFKSTTQVW